MGRPKTTSVGAKRTTIYLNPAEDVALNVLENIRRSRQEKRHQPSEIIADALWFYLDKVEGKTQDQVKALLSIPTNTELMPSKITEMRKQK
jgi:hypothetical protein